MFIWFILISHLKEHAELRVPRVCVDDPQVVGGLQRAHRRQGLHGGGGGGWRPANAAAATAVVDAKAWWDEEFIIVHAILHTILMARTRRNKYKIVRAGVPVMIDELK